MKRRFGAMLFVAVAVLATGPELDACGDKSLVCWRHPHAARNGRALPSVGAGVRALELICFCGCG